MTGEVDVWPAPAELCINSGLGDGPVPISYRDGGGARGR